MGSISPRELQVLCCKLILRYLATRSFQAMIDSDYDTLQTCYTHSTAQSDTRAEYIALCKKTVFKYLKIERPIPPERCWC